MSVLRFYYFLKPFIPRPLQIQIRRILASIKRSRCKHVWPIDYTAGKPPSGWKGWPENKRFALVLTHDVDTAQGLSRVKELAMKEMEYGFRSSFNFVPERYSTSESLRNWLVRNGFEIGVHGLLHDGKLYKSRSIFLQRASKINYYLKKWHAIGFRSPAMHHNFEWLHDLEIGYDASTFDTDPFEPQSDGVRTLFPFWISDKNGNGYVELPYTLPQDHCLFIILKEKNIDIWKRKLDWIAEKGGMALINTHPDYMSFNHNYRGLEQYPISFYIDFLKYVTANYGYSYWHALPKDISQFWRDKMITASHN